MVPKLRAVYELEDWLPESRFTITRLAEELGVSRSTIHRWMSGNRPIPLRAALHIQDLSDIPPRYWIEEIEKC